MGIAPFDGESVESVFPGMAAERGGMRKGDIVLTYQDNPIDNETTGRLIETVNLSAGSPMRFTVLRDGKTLNVAAEQHDDQRLSIVYGMSTPQLEKVLKHLEAEPKKSLIQEAITTEEEANALQSKWSIQMVHFTPLIVPARYLMGR